MFPDLTDHFKPINSPKWIDFKIAFGADLEPYEKPHLRFPVHSGMSKDNYEKNLEVQRMIEQSREKVFNEFHNM